MQFLWIITSILAGTFQTIRNATSKSLAKKLSSESVTFVRFAYAIPFTIIYLLALWFLQISFGEFNSQVLIFATLAAIVQATANFLMVKLFAYKNFAVSINFIKSDNLFAAVMGITFFAEYLSVIGWLAVLLSVLGIFLVNYKKTEIRDFHKILDRALLIGLASGGLFALSSFFVKFANASYSGGNILANSATTLIFVLVIQSILLGIYILKFKSHEILSIAKHWRSDFAIGTTSSLASIFWFLSFSLAPVALVRTAGQIEMVLTLIITHAHFKEKLRWNEFVGICLTLLGLIFLAVN